MKFKVNGNIWVIKELSKEKMELENSLGETNYETQEIHLLDVCKSKKIR